MDLLKHYCEAIISLFGITSLQQDGYVLFKRINIEINVPILIRDCHDVFFSELPRPDACTKKPSRFGMTSTCQPPSV